MAMVTSPSIQDLEFMKYAYLLPLIIACSLAIADADALPDLNTMRIGLNSADAKEYAFSLYSHGSKFSTILERIESGDPDWLTLGRLLEKHADGWIATSLFLSFANAIQKNPKSALSIMTDHEIFLSCSVPLLEPTKYDFDTFVKNTMEAVQELDDVELSEKKKLCLGYLEEAQYFSENNWPDSF